MSLNKNLKRKVQKRKNKNSKKNRPQKENQNQRNKGGNKVLKTKLKYWTTCRSKIGLTTS